MTAEVVIMNKEGVALAADSAVTIIGERGKKILTSANKMFALSRYYPIGIMVYGEANFLEIPWEIIIKIYRSKLKNKKFDTLKEYSDDFLDFLNREKQLFPESEQENHLKRYIYSYFFHIKQIIKKKWDQTLIIKNNKITIKEIKDIISEIIKEHHKKWKETETIPNLPKNHNEQCEKKYGKIIEKAKKDIFDKLPLGQSHSKLLIELALNLFSKIPEKFFRPYFSGIVIMGFGNEDIFPSLQSFLLEGVVNNVLQYKKHAENNINFETTAVIRAFAQKEMVVTFMEGVSPNYEKEIEKYFSQICDEYPQIIIENINKLNNEMEVELKKKLKKISNEWKEKNKIKLREYRRKKYINPVINGVSILPKKELAAMAESLVSLTSFKKKVTIEEETVAGPIDVAIISKGDGFIWIKRKLYFKQELNPQFFVKYKKEVESDAKS